MSKARGSIWTKGKSKFQGSYGKAKKERIFILTNIKTKKEIEFGGPSQAKSAGYSMVK